MRRFALWLLGLALGVAQAQAPNPQISLEVNPQNAATTPFTYRSVVDPQGATLQTHRVVVEYTDRAGRGWQWVIASGRGSTLSGEWSLRNSSSLLVERISPLDTTSRPYKNALASLSYRGYRGRDGTLYSTGGYAPGVYTFYSEATLVYRAGWSTRSVTVRSPRLVRSVLYAGLTDAQTLRRIFYYSQRIWMEKAPTEWGGGQIDGPYSPNPNTRSRPWIGGIFLGFQPGGILDTYFKNYGLKGYLAIRSRFEQAPTCGGLDICSAFEAYDPDWIVGLDSERVRDEALKQLEAFLATYAQDYGGKIGFYWYRGLSRTFFAGDYDPKGFLLFQTEPRDYLFFSQTGQFRDGEDFLVVELPPGFAATFRAVLRWGELKRELPECTASGCPEKDPKEKPKTP